MRKLGRDNRGFTLIEMMIVIAMIALISSLALPSISNIFRFSLDNATRELAATVRETYNAAVITGRVHRIAYDLEAEQFWAETGPASLLLETEESLEIKERRRRLRGEEEEETSRFKPDASITRKKIALPEGVVIDAVFTEQSPDPIEIGKAYTHMFPHGISERTILHLSDSEDHRLSLVITPILAKVRMMDGHVSPDEIFQK